jgi:hypothetical protein
MTTQKQYKVALARIREIIDAKPHMRESRELDRLAEDVRDYERTHCIESLRTDLVHKLTPEMMLKGVLANSHRYSTGQGSQFMPTQKFCSRRRKVFVLTFPALRTFSTCSERVSSRITFKRG